MTSFSVLQILKEELCIRENKNYTSALVFIIAGTEYYRVWLCDSRNGNIIEGDLLRKNI